VKIKFKDYDRRVLPDMGAKISFLSPNSAQSAESNQPFLAVPLAAVTTRNGRPIVYRVKDNRALEVPVVIGRQTGSLVEIKQGLQNGDKVISRVDEKIRDGAKVYLSNP
jgi:HlyD family secretion protein